MMLIIEDSQRRTLLKRAHVERLKSQAIRLKERREPCVCVCVILINFAFLHHLRADTSLPCLRVAEF